MSGPNGERIDGPGADASLARWTDPAPTERLGEFVYSRWKVDAPLPARPTRLSARFALTVILFCAAMIGLATVVAARIREGDVLMSQVAPFVLLALVFAPYVAIIVHQRRKRAAKTGSPTPPPPGVPPKAIPALAGMNNRGRSLGWLWFEGDRMLFRGAGFDFRLRREDFVGKGSLRNAWYGKEGAALRTPPSIASHRLRLYPGVLLGDAFAGDPKRWDELKDDLAAWESGTYSAEPSVFPPVRPVPTVEARIGWAQVVVPPLVMGGLLLAAGLLLPPAARDGRPNDPAGLAIAGALFGLMWPGLLLGVRGEQRAKRREVERAFAEEAGA